MTLQEEKVYRYSVLSHADVNQVLLKGFIYTSP
jgi:hypothetical protein